MFLYENDHFNHSNKYDLNVFSNEFLVVLWPNYRGALIFFFEFDNLQASTYVVSHVCVKFHQIIIKSENIVGKCSTRGFLAFCDQITKLYQFFSFYFFSIL
jgi:hypothetical protein